MGCVHRRVSGVVGFGPVVRGLVVTVSGFGCLGVAWWGGRRVWWGGLVDMGLTTVCDFPTLRVVSGGKG